jgi:HTH-type transcriptional regulator, transcriptional repressor of NAD biosynthesis genes
MSRGFVLGKFMPPHDGHLMLCDFARAYCDELTILVCTRGVEPINGELRHQWMRELCSWARVVHYDQHVPQEPSEHPDFWNIWRGIVKAAHPELIDFVFASEEYGARLAKEVGARFVPFDPDRLAAPISATQIRADPFSVWHFLPRPVRAYYAKTVCLCGPESTGKSTLARQLAAYFKTITAPEYGRTYCEVFGTECDAEDLRAIARGHEALSAAARLRANRLLIQDTDAVMTAVWADMLLGHRPDDLNRIARTADLYLLTDIDLDWRDDGTRYAALSSIEARSRFYSLCRDELIKRNLPFVAIGGTGETRLAAAISAVRQRFPDLPV